MINSTTEEYYRNYYGAYLSKYYSKKNAQDTRFNYILAFIIICILLATLALTPPLFASDTKGATIAYSPPPSNSIILDKRVFEQNIKQKYKTNQINFPTAGIAHIRKIKYINSKPVNINIVEINTKVNPYLKIKPKTAFDKKIIKSIQAEQTTGLITKFFKSNTTSNCVFK